MLNKGLAEVDPKTRKILTGHIQEIASALQSHRKKQGWTQESLAEALDVSVNTIKYIEQGRRLPSLVMILRIAHVLKIKLHLQRA